MTLPEYIAENLKSYEEAKTITLRIWYLKNLRDGVTDVINYLEGKDNASTRVRQSAEQDIPERV